MFNQVLLAGRLVKDPEIITLENGNKVTEVRIAVQRPFRSRDTSQYETDFFNVTLWQGLAQTVFYRCKKGTLVIMKGRLVDDHYKDKEGKTIYQVKIIAERLSYVSQSKQPEDEMDEEETREEE